MLRLTTMKLDLISRQSTCAKAYDSWFSGDMNLNDLPQQTVCCVTAQRCLHSWQGEKQFLDLLEFLELPPQARPAHLRWHVAVYVQLFGLSLKRTLPCNIPVGEELEVLASDRFLPRPASFLLLSPGAIRLMSRTQPRLCLQLRAAFVVKEVPDSC